MSLLWKDCKKKKQLTIHKRPSPICKISTYRLPQGTIIPMKKRDFPISPVGPFIKGISLLTSLERKVCGSMTVEASICLPLFLFFFLNLGSAIEMIRLHSNLELAMWEAGNRLAVYGHVLDKDSNESDSWGMELAGVAMSYTYVKSQIIEYLGEGYLENSPLSYGTEGLQFVESNIWETDGRFELVLTYAVSPLTDMAGFRSFRMANRYYGHLWNGYRIPGTDDGDVEQYVYITENGQVYHTNRSCTHLALSIRQVGLMEAYGSTNAQGQKYNACEKCSKWGYHGGVYITKEGECYHYEKECPGLKRTVYLVPLADMGNKRLCQRCNSG